MIFKKSNIKLHQNHLAPDLQSDITKYFEIIFMKYID